MLALRWLKIPQRTLSFTAPLAINFTAPQYKGHSKWQNIKATKGKNDMIKSQATNQLLLKVRAAVNKGGFDIKLNRELAQLEQEFRAQGLSLDTFRNFLQKIKDKPEVAVTFDVIGPSGTFFIVVGETESKKAFEGTLRKYFNKVGGFRMAADASAVRSWFDEKGVLLVDTKKDGKEVTIEQMEEVGIEADCEEVSLVEEEGSRKFELLCDSKKLPAIERDLSKQGFSIESAEVEFRPLHPVQLEGDDATKVEKFYELIQEDENIRQIYDNIEPSSVAATA